MSKSEIGLCGLLTGSSATAEAFEVLPAQVEACIQEVRYENSQTLKALREFICARSKETDLNQAASIFRIPVSVLRVVVGQPLVALEPEKPKSSPKKPQPAAKDLKKPVIALAKRHSEVLEVPQVKPPEEKKSPKVARDEPEKQQASSLSESDDVKALRQKIYHLYNNGVKYNVIAALYKLPVSLVHTWGNWSQLTPAKAEENRSLSNSAKELINSGVSEREVMEACGLKNQKSYNNLIGRYEFPKSFTSEQKVGAVEYTKVLRNIKRASEELDIPHKRLRSWVNKEDLSSDEDFMASGRGKREDANRLKALEAYYLSDKSVTAAAKLIGESDVYKIINWVTEFEKSSLSTPKKRQKLQEASETLEVED